MTLAPVAPAAASDAEFRRAFGEQFFDRYWELSPSAAVASGYYQYADRLIVPDQKARDTALAQIDRSLAELARIDPASLSSGVRADWAMLDNQLRGERWSLTELNS